MKNNILQLHNQSERTVEKIDCPFSMPMSRKERPPMTKPREKTREELQAEIEGGKKKMRQFENREKMLRQKLFKEERRTRSHRLIVRGAVFESIVPEAKGMTNEESATFLLLLCHVYFSFFQALNLNFPVIQTGIYRMTFSNRNIPSGNCSSSSSEHISGSFGSW